MRILLTAVPVTGHLLPLLPMAAAAERRGDRAAILVSDDLQDLVGHLDARVVGPPIWTTRDLTVTRLGRDWTGPGPEAAEMFAGVRLETTLAPALEEARRFAPDLIIGDSLDFVGPTVAASLGVPWVEHAISGGLPPVFLEAMASRWQRSLDELGLSLLGRTALVDPYPNVLHDPEQALAADRLPVHFEAYSRPGSSELPTFADPTLPTALVTCGMSTGDTTTSAALTASVAASGINVITTDPGSASPRVAPLSFTPLASIVSQVDVVVSVGGTGTVLTALGAGKPLVLLPHVADQPLNARRVERVGAGVVIDDPSGAGAAASAVLGEHCFSSAAQSVSAAMDALPSADEVLGELLGREVG